jgi:hypothetical protein
MLVSFKRMAADHYARYLPSLNVLRQSSDAGTEPCDE